VTYAKAKKKLDDTFSKYIRMKYSPDGEHVQCISCGKFKEIKRMQAGHYISRKELALRWDERNVHPQCVKCNMFSEGNKPAHAIKLIEMYGDGILQRLQVDSKRMTKLATFELVEMEKEYKKKLIELQALHN